MNSKISLLIFSIILATALGTYTTDVDLAATKLVGLDCMTKAVKNLDDIVKDATFQIRRMCGPNVASSLSSLTIDSIDFRDIITKVITTNKLDCNNGSFNEILDATKVPSATCITNYTTQMRFLEAYINLINTEISNAITPATGTPIASACARIALTNYQFGLKNLPTVINTCASI